GRSPRLGIRPLFSRRAGVLDPLRCSNLERHTPHGRTREPFRDRAVPPLDLSSGFARGFGIAPPGARSTRDLRDEVGAVVIPYRLSVLFGWPEAGGRTLRESLELRRGDYDALTGAIRPDPSGLDEHVDRRDAHPEGFRGFRAPIGEF